MTWNTPAGRIGYRFAAMMCNKKRTENKREKKKEMLKKEGREGRGIETSGLSDRIFILIGEPKPAPRSALPLSLVGRTLSEDHSSIQRLFFFSPGGWGG